MTDFDWITDQAEFDELVDELAGTSAYALDTEFHRERTYLPQLAVVQLATRNRVALVDALAVDVRALSRAFQSDAVCVMHAGSQDLEILELVSGAVPRRMFDTQTGESQDRHARRGARGRRADGRRSGTLARAPQAMGRPAAPGTHLLPMTGRVARDALR